MHRLTACLLTASLLALPACDPLGNKSDDAGGKSSAGDSSKPPAPRPAVKRVGKTRVALDRQLGRKALVELVSVTTYAHGAKALGGKPKSGTWALLKVKVKGVVRKTPVNTFYFTVRPPGGKLATQMTGAAGTIETPGPRLKAIDVGPGQIDQGNVLLDTKVPSGSRVYFTDPLDKPLAYWQL